MTQAEKQPINQMGISRQRVAERAYFIFEERNKTSDYVIHGYDVQDWLQAQKELTVKRRSPTLKKQSTPEQNRGLEDKKIEANRLHNDFVIKVKEVLNQIIIHCAASSKTSAKIDGQSKDSEVVKPKWQIKDEEWNRRWNMAFSKKTNLRTDESEQKLEPKPEKEAENSRIDADIDIPRHPLGRRGTRDAERLIEIYGAYKPKPQTIRNFLVTPEDTVQILEKWNSQREERLKREADQRKIDPIAQSITAKKPEVVKEAVPAVETQGMTEKAEAEKSEIDALTEARVLADKAAENARKEQEELKKATGKIAVEKAAAKEEGRREGKAQGIREGEAKGKQEGKEQGEWEGKEKLWNEIKGKRSIKDKFRIFFRPKTETEKYLSRDYRKKAAYFVGGTAIVTATWAILQANGTYLPFSEPIKEIIIKVNGTLIK